MTKRGLPFEIGEAGNRCNHGKGCSLRPLLSPELRDACEESPFLSDYLHTLPVQRIGMPTYYPVLSRDLGNLEMPNIIYPIQNGLYVHIYPDRGARDYYITIEPDLTLDLDDLTQQIESKLLDYADRIGAAETEEERRQALLDVIDDLCIAEGDDGAAARGPDGQVTVTLSGKLVVSARELEGLKYRLLRDKIGLGVLQPLLEDPYIEDISCSGTGPIFIEHKIFKSVQSSVVFDTLDELDNFVVWLGEWIKRPVTVRNPIVDAVLPDGSRINIVYGREIATRGSNFTIRKFSDKPMSILQLIEFGTLDYTMAAYLSFMLEEGLNVFVAGATASGKTTLLNALNTFILPDAKIVTIEDTPEVQVPHKNWVREVTRGAAQGEKGGEVGMFELLKAALRQRPDRIIIGEIRGVEGAIAFQAMQTGHGVMSTFHAASVERLIQRLTGDPINVPKTYIDNLNVAVIQAAVRSPSGKKVRRVLSVNEILGYDPTTESFSFIEAFRWNPVTDGFDFPGNMNSFLMEEVIAMKRGIPPHKRKSVYSDLKKRARIFERIHKDRGVRDFDSFFQILAEAHTQGLL